MLGVLTLSMVGCLDGDVSPKDYNADIQVVNLEDIQMEH